MLRLDNEMSNNNNISNIIILTIIWIYSYTFQIDGVFLDNEMSNKSWFWGLLVWLKRKRERETDSQRDWRRGGGRCWPLKKSFSPRDLALTGLREVVEEEEEEEEEERQLKCSCPLMSDGEIRLGWWMPVNYRSWAG